MPDNQLQESLKEYKADILALSVTLPIHVSKAAALIKKIRSNKDLSNLKMMVGGYPFLTNPDLWQRVAANAYAQNADQAMAMANELVSTLKIIFINLILFCMYNTIILHTFTQLISYMKGSNLGEFEELVLLTVAALIEEAYSVAICDVLSDHTGRTVKLGVVHAVLNRLEEKGFVESQLGEATKRRGGKRKRFYQLTIPGKNALVRAKSMRDQLWDKIPLLNWNKI